MTHTQALKDSTQQLYKIFGGYVPQPDVTGIPLTKLSYSHLTPIVKHPETFGDASIVLRHFLPRILELSIDGYHRWSMGLEDVFRSLNTVGWRFWMDEEVQAIEAFIYALWEHHLYEVSPTGTTSSADTLLEACGQIIDINPLLDTWTIVSGRTATAHIASLTVYGKKHHRAVRRWLEQPAVLQRIEAAFWDCNDSDNAAMFAKAAEYLRLNDTAPVPA